MLTKKEHYLNKYKQKIESFQVELTKSFYLAMN